MQVLSLVVGGGLMFGCSGGAATPTAAGPGVAAAPEAQVAKGSEGPGAGVFQKRVEGPDGSPGVVMHFGGAPDNVIRTVARTLNLSEDAVRGEWSEQPLADVARAYSVEPAVVAEALQTENHAMLLREAAAGRIPPAMVDEARGAYGQVVDSWLAQPLQSKTDDAPQFMPPPGDAPVFFAQ